MAYRGGGITGTNNVPLGTRRRFGGGDDYSESPSLSNTPAPDTRHSVQVKLDGEDDDGIKRGRSPNRCMFTFFPSLWYAPLDEKVSLTFTLLADEPRKRKKKNRWGEQTDNKAAGLMGLPTAIFATMTNEQLEAYTLHLRIEEISQKIRINDVVPADGDRWVFLFYLV